MEVFFLIIITIVIITLAFTQGFSVPKIKGYFGEIKVAGLLKSLDKSNYKVINNLVLNINGRTSQIDHLVISNYGIFVIETKNYNGWILGSENSEYWTQVVYRRKHVFYNPIFQNAGHIKALKYCLKEYSNAKYFSIIVFISSAEIKVNTTAQVIHTANLISTIYKYTEANISDNERDIIFQKINQLNSIATFEKDKHIQFINQKVQERSRLVKENRCQKCGSNLIVRNGKFGEFLGCSTYPKCKFTCKC
jgi:hypothetical protein